MKKLVFIFPILFISYIGFRLINRNIINDDYIEVSGGGGDLVHYLSKSDYDLKEKAIASSDITLCQKIKEKESSHAFNQYNACVKGIAKNTKDTSICKTYFKDRIHVDGCMLLIAVESLNERICETTAYNYFDCYDAVMGAKARSTGDLNYCLNQISPDKSAKYNCIQNLAKDPAQCKEYFDKVTPKDSYMYNLYIKECAEKP